MLLLVAAPAFVSAQSFDALRAAGYDLPPRLGVTLSFYSQTQAYDIDSIMVGVPGVDSSVLSGLSIDNRTDTIHAMVDYWLFPFLDVFALGGHVEGTTTVKLENLDIGLPIRLNNLRIDYTGTVYGGGVTFAGGWRNYFGSLTYEYTSTDLDVTTSSIDVWVCSLKLGYKVQGGAVWIGAMYQDVDEHDHGSYTMPYIGSFPFDVRFKAKEPLNYQIGASAGVGEHFVITFEAGFGDRDSAMATLGYRF